MPLVELRDGKGARLLYVWFASEAEGFVKASGQSRGLGGPEGGHPRKIIYAAKRDLEEMGFFEWCGIT